jgi:hypothetical protein
MPVNKLVLWRQRWRAPQLAAAGAAAVTRVPQGDAAGESTADSAESKSAEMLKKTMWK